MFSGISIRCFKMFLDVFTYLRSNSKILSFGSAWLDILCRVWGYLVTRAFCGVSHKDEVDRDGIRGAGFCLGHESFHKRQPVAG